MCTALNSLSSPAHRDIQETLFEVGELKKTKTKKNQEAAYSTVLYLDLVRIPNENLSLCGTNNTSSTQGCFEYYVRNKKKYNIFVKHKSSLKYYRHY